jgi:phosphoribosyl 1,2-cyclic phosphodiesterase
MVHWNHRQGGITVLEFSVLASGSSGNAIFIRTESTRILLDAGISGRQLQNRLMSVADVSLNDLDAVLITHEHIDHVRGLKQAAKQSDAALYITQGTWHQVRPELTEMATDRLHHVADAGTFFIGDIQVTPFAVSHDAEEPVAYRFDSGDASLAVATDLGYMSDSIKTTIQGCQCYILETNHDVDMLRAGRYPWSVKRRILSDKGHLSNEDAAVALTDLFQDGPLDVYLAHLSEENNQRDLAELTVSSLVRDIRASAAEGVQLHHTSRLQPTPLRRIAGE